VSTLGRWPHIFPGRVAHPAIFWPGGAFWCVAQVSRPLPKIGCPIQASPPWRTSLSGVFVLDPSQVRVQPIPHGVICVSRASQRAVTIQQSP